MKDASSENNTLAGKKGSVALFPKYHCAKPIGDDYDYPSKYYDLVWEVFVECSLGMVRCNVLN